MDDSRPWRRNRSRFYRKPEANKFPSGKLDADDEGELNVAISHYRGTVRIEFGKKIEWFAMSPEQARGLGELLIEYADEIEIIKNGGH